MMSVQSALWRHWYKEQLCGAALGDYKWFQLSWRLCSPRFLSLVKILKKKGEMCSSLIKYISAIYRKKTVQMVAMILVQMPQYQLSNFCLRVCFYLFHHPNQTGSGSPGWMGEIDCSHDQRLKIMTWLEKISKGREDDQRSEDQEDAHSDASPSTVGGSPYLIWCMSVSHVASMWAGKVRK